MKVNSKYGYKVCYKELGKDKYKIFLATNSFESAVWHIRWCERKPPPKLKNPSWEVCEIKTKKEYDRLWKGCPFKDDLS